MNNKKFKCSLCHDKGRPDDWFGKLNQNQIINQKKIYWRMLTFVSHFSSLESLLQHTNLLNYVVS